MQEPAGFEPRDFFEGEKVKWICLFCSFCRHDSLLEEYARYLPFGLSVASSFLQNLHTDDVEMANDQSIEENIRSVLDKGGDVVDAELRSLVVDIYRFHEKFNLTLEKL